MGRGARNCRQASWSVCGKSCGETSRLVMAVGLVNSFIPASRSKGQNWLGREGFATANKTVQWPVLRGERPERKRRAGDPGSRLEN